MNRIEQDFDESERVRYPDGSLQDEDEDENEDEDEDEEEEQG